MTRRIYFKLNTVLNDSMEIGDTLIEVGPGTGNNLKYIKDTLIRKEASYTGIDYDSSYTKLLKEEIKCFKKNRIYHGRKNGDFLEQLDDDKRFVCEDGTMHLLLIECTMLMDLARVKAKISSLTSKHKNIKIYFAHTEFEDDLHVITKAFLDVLKPLLYYITTVDFGRPTYSSEFNSIISTCGLKVEQSHFIGDSVHDSTGLGGKLMLYVTSPL